MSEIADQVDALIRGELVVRHDVIDGAGVRKLLDVSTRHALLRWRAKPGFPKPFKRTDGGTELWDRAEVIAWLGSHGQRDAPV